MLLPSDIARLVLGYLQQEGLTSTSRAFILESPNLKEYAEHCTEDGLIPACVFSLFGKNLKTVLNEYVAVKTKEISQENQVPAMLTSLWKKLDVTLNQIKCMQNSPIVYSSQRMRTKNGILRHRALQSCLSSASPIVVSDCVPAPSPCVSSPMATAPAHSTTVCISSLQARPSPLALSHPHIQDGSRLSVTQSHNTPLQVIVADQRFNTGPLSPARRKCDSPRRRGGCLAAGSGTTRASMVPSSLTQDGQSEEVVSENFPQMVIENAREKILKDRSLQEKLAENINKILASDNSPQASKASSSSVDHDQSIDEILGLQGEIHMTDDAIQDILEQTESDPAFQALFDLFDYGKSKASSTDEVEQGQRDQDCEDITCTEESSDIIEPSPDQLDPTPYAQPSSALRSKMKGAQESKSKRKSMPSSSSASTNPTSTTPPAPTPNQPASENQALGLGSSFLDPKQRGSKRYTRAAQHASQADRSVASEQEENMVDDNFAAAEMDLMPLTPVQPEASAGQCVEEQPGLADGGQLLVATSDFHLSCPSGTIAENEQLNESRQERDTHLLNGPLTNKAVVRESDQSGKQDQLDSPVKTRTQRGEAGQKPHVPDGVRRSEVRSVTSSPPTSSRSATVSASPLVMESDPSQIVSLKIIVSDEQEQSSTDATLSQAVSSIADDRLPTIYLSSPAKFPAKGVLLPPVSSSGVTSEETVQAVTCLQRTQQPTPANDDGAQEPGFIQLFPASAGPSSYFVVADQMVSGDGRSSVVVVPGAPAAQGQVNTLPQVVATPPRSQAVTQSYGSTFIISSPMQSMLQSVVVPVSVMGQNNAGKLTVVPNQVIGLPCRTSLTQPALVAKSKLAARTDNSNPGKAVKSASGSVQKAAVALSSPNTETLKTGGPQGHVRMLCFDTPLNTSMPSPNPAPAVGDKPKQTSSSRPTEKQKSTEGVRGNPSPKPIILGGGSRARRRVETVRVEDKISQPLAFSENGDFQNRDLSVRDASRRPDTGESSTPKTAAPATQQVTGTGSESRRKPQISQQLDKGSMSIDIIRATRASDQSCRHRIKSSAARSDGQDTLKSQDGLTERTESPQQVSPITANKENELEAHKGMDRSMLGTPGQQESTSATSGAMYKALSKTSPLTKQAAEMLQDIQGLHPLATPPKKSGLDCLDLPLPRTPGLGRLHEDSLDGLRTPSRQRQGREREGTPRHLVPPATPELPSCSPASETGSENSINMAAHTLMILSRAARTGVPLKDSLRQEEVALPVAVDKSKKRKQDEQSPADKIEYTNSRSRKKAKKQKRLLDSFPDDLDVDKFLSSLHYDE